MVNLHSFTASVVVAGAVGFLVVLALTPLVRIVAHRVGAVAHPKSDRWNTRTVPMLGGTGIFLGTLVGFATAGRWSPGMLPVVVAGAAMFAVGLIDDFLHLKPSTKLTAQTAAACLAVMLGGAPEWSGTGLIGNLFAILWIIAVTNALNLLDNMDGLCAGIAAIAACGFTIDLIGTQSVVAIYAAALAGGCLGFLVYNFKPASIFMGDGGSLFLGISLATLSSVGGASAGTRLVSSVAVPALILMIPIFDTTFVTLSRLLSTRSAAQGGRDHTSHRLVAMGFSESDAVLILWALAAAGGLAAVLARHSSTSDAVLVGPLLLITLVLLGIQLARVRVYDGDDFSLLLRRPYTPLLLDVAYKRRIFEVLLDLVLVAFSYYAAYVIRFDREFPLYAGLFEKSLPVVIACQLTCFFATGVYRGTWRYMGLGDATTYVKAIALAVLSSIMVVVYVYRFEGFSRGVFAIDAMLLALLVVGSRLSFRIVGDAAGRHRRTGQPVIVYGAGDGGALLVRELRDNPHRGYEPVAFLDDDPAKHRRRMMRLLVVGGAETLPDAVAEYRPYAVIISTDKIDPARRAAVERICFESGTALMQLRFRLEPIVRSTPAAID
jgi:UDP-GlcNAc:undecaprenyl-phosphate GlcNAc-1-phosphate transferase